MDMVSSCRDKLSCFRIKELKDVLTQLGLVKQGKKQDLVDRILALLSNEQVPKSHVSGKRNVIGKDVVAKIIDDIYRKIQLPGSADSLSKSHSGSDFNYVKPKEEIDDSKLDMKIRCLCGSSLVKESMIKCEDPRCDVWQHIGCVIIPDKPLDGFQPEIPPRFYCEICRINKADPFWVSVAHPLLSVKLTSPSPAADGTSTAQSTEKTFQLSRADRDLLQKTEYDLQVWCILLNDEVPFRMQWPQFSDLVVNGIGLRTTNRPGSQLLGINGRDDGLVITTYSMEGINKITFTRCDARTFCFGVRIAKRRNIQQVLNMIPKEADGEHFEDALNRVCRCIGGGAAAENADSDNDLEVVADSVPVSLRCPMSASRIKIAGRFKACVHMRCFDLETFVELNQRSRKWQCPICMQNYSLENIIIDPYFNRITSLLQNCGEDVNEIDVKPDGSWRVKSEGENRTLGQWHLPDGTPCVFTDAEVKSDSDFLKQTKQESMGLKLGIKRNRNGIWEVSKPKDMTPVSSGNHAQEKFENQCQKVVPLSVSATGSHRDGDDSSVNQDGRGHFDFAANGQELDSINFDVMYNIDDRMPPAPTKDSDIIVLSDSEEDHITLISPEPAYDTGRSNGTGIPFTATNPGVEGPFIVNPGLGTSAPSCLGLFSNGDDYEMPLWPLQTCSQTGSGFQLFNTDLDVADTLVDVHRNSLPCPPMNGYGLASNDVTEDALQPQNLASCPPNDHHHHEDLPHQSRLGPSTCCSNAEVSSSLVDNPLAFAGDDPTLQIFLPTQPAVMPAQSHLSQQLDINGTHMDDWTTLRLGGIDGNHVESVVANELNSRRLFGTNEDRMTTLANTASLLLNMNDAVSNTGASNNRRSGNYFPHPQQPRSVKPRLYLNIDSD